MSRPAFPTDLYERGDFLYTAEGMTLRQYYAAKAMQAMITNPAINDTGAGYAECAKGAFAFADAMIAFEEKP